MHITRAHGSQSAQRSDWAPLKGKSVAILPDNDQPGFRYADTVAHILTGLGCRVKIVHLAGLPEGGDIVDFIDARDSCDSDDLRRMIEEIVAATPQWQPAKASDGCETLQWQPFPVEVLPEPVGLFVAKGARAIGCDPSYIALPLLSGLASAIGNTRCIQLKRGWSEPAIVWTAIVGESGTLKTPAFKPAMKPIRDRQDRALKRYAEALASYESDVLRYEKELGEWKRKRKDAGDPPEKPQPPHAERCIVSDTTIEALAPLLLANPRG